MRIAGSTIRRGYMKRYEKNYSNKYDSEKKVQTGRKFVRSSENPIDAAKALRVRKSIAEVKTYQNNLQSADSIYTNAETSMRTVSEVIQTVYEKLIEGAHGTRNRDDLEIIAKELDNHAEEMVQSFNVDVADRKVFGGLNNTTVAFKIETDAGGGKYVTYNGEPVNSSSDPTSFPFSGESYLDIGIGMSTDGKVDRIDDQSALPITFNGAECSGCGVTKRTAVIDLNSIRPGLPYKIDVSAGGVTHTVEFNGGDTNEKTVENLNNALKAAFQVTPEVGADGKIKYLENLELPGDPNISNYKNATIDGPSVDLSSLTNGGSYSLQVSANGTTEVIDFTGTGSAAGDMAAIQAALDGKFGADAPKINDKGTIVDSKGNPSYVRSLGTDTASINDVSAIDLDSLEKDNWYSFEITANGKTRVIDFAATGNKLSDLDAIRDALNDRFGKDDAPSIYSDGSILDAVGLSCAAKNTGDYSRDVDIANDGTLNLASLEAGKEYSINVAGQKVTFTAGANAEDTAKNINEVFKQDNTFGKPVVPYSSPTGTLIYDKPDAGIVIDNSHNAPNKLEFSDIKGYSKNIMQLVLDGAQALRDGDQTLAARYADLIYAAQGTLSIAIADLGTHSKFIEFNQDRLDDVLINLYDKQNDLEITDLPDEITNWKVLDAVYNATLQMGSTVLPQSIFNYIK